MTHESLLDAEHANSSQEGILSEERYSLDDHDVVAFAPNEIRTDLTTGEPVANLLFVQGINGDPKAELIARTFAKRDKRRVITIPYRGLGGSAKPVRPGHKYYREGAVISELDANEAEDIIGALDMLGATQPVDIVAESRGGIRALAALEEYPGRFRYSYFKDPAGLDGRNFRQTHVDALRLVGHDRVQRLLGGSAVQLDGSDKLTAIRSARNLRTEQESVAIAQMSAVLARINNNSVTVASDVDDAGFRTRNVYSAMLEARVGENGNVLLIGTHTGGHGIGTNERAIEATISGLHDMELMNSES
jgi:pimeloyl-ACP methyl ester carboxylesterase